MSQSPNPGKGTLPIRDGRGNGVCRICMVYTPITILLKHDGRCVPCSLEDEQLSPDAQTFAAMAAIFLDWSLQDWNDGLPAPKRQKDTPEHREDV